MTKPKDPFVASLKTAVTVASSVKQIQEIVEKFGAAEFTIRYDTETRAPRAIAFKVRDPHLSGSPVFLPVELQAPTETVYAMLRGRRGGYVGSDVTKRLKEQAERTAWRNLHDFVRASLIGVQTGIMSLGEAFMASLIVTLPNGESKRLGEIAANGNLLQPGHGGRLMLGRGE